MADSKKTPEKPMTLADMHSEIARLTELPYSAVKNAFTAEKQDDARYYSKALNSSEDERLLGATGCGVAIVFLFFAAGALMRNAGLQAMGVFLSAAIASGIGGGMLFQHGTRNAERLRQQVCNDVRETCPGHAGPQI